jgi:hypothetical protein
MNDCDKDYRVVIDERIREMSSVPEYKMTGKKLSQQISRRLAQIGANLIKSEELKEFSLDLGKISKRHVDRKVRAFYGNLSSDIVNYQRK